MPDKNVVISIKDLTLDYTKDKKAFRVFENFSLDIKRGEKIVLLGESGSGKSTLAKALLGLLPQGASIKSGWLYMDEWKIPLYQKFRFWNKIRGTKATMIYQDASEALNPMKTVYRHFLDLLLYHRIAKKEEVYDIARELLKDFLFDNPDKVLSSYAFELSGGMCQRVCIALCVSLKPDIIIADEPTSALDVISQYEVLNALKSLNGQTVLMITHDIAAADMLADRIVVLKEGRICEDSPKTELLNKPKHQYTKNMISSYLAIDKIKYDKIQAGSGNELEIKALRKSYGEKREIIDNLNVEIKRGEIFSILGISGCGKSTLSRCIMGLETNTEGEIIYNGINLLKLKSSERRKLAPKIQIVFQEARGSLNPNVTALNIVQEPLIYHRLYDKESREKMAKKLLYMVGIEDEMFNSKPMQLSTGQCQRIGIARALIMKPEILICDEAVSSLDVTLQVQILELLIKLKKEFNLTIIMISHDFRVLKNISDHIAVMHEGQFIEVHDNAKGIINSSNPYTRKLINSTHLVKTAGNYQ